MPGVWDVDMEGVNVNKNGDGNDVNLVVVDQLLGCDVIFL